MRTATLTPSEARARAAIQRSFGQESARGVLGAVQVAMMASGGEFEDASFEPGSLGCAMPARTAVGNDDDDGMQWLRPRFSEVMSC